ncbi:MAG: hypothetical protein RLZZ352_256 [Pseudomonadota bacterium]|jgi:uncharacterized protein YhaN
MRIHELKLIRYGKFTDRSLSLPWRARDIHLIVGPNEAGKSTVRNAISDWLFGMGMRTPWAFLHPMPELRLGGVLQRGTPGSEPTESLAFDRTKGNKNTLRTPSDQVLPDTALQSWLGPWQASAFTRLHALDHDTLVKGGAGILAASDDMGRLLFQSAAGLQHLGEQLQALRDEADALWGKRRSQSRQYHQALDALEAAKADFKQATLRSADWVEQHKALADTEAALHSARQRDAQIRQHISRLERLRRVRPLLQALDAARARHQSLGGQPPRLPPDATERLASARQSLALLAADQARLQDSLQQTQTALEGLSLTPALLLRAPDITHLNERRLQFRAHRSDLIKRQDELRHDWQQAQQLAQQLGWPADLEDSVRQRLPAAPLRKRLQRLLQQRLQNLQDLQAAQNQMAEREQEVQQMAQALSRLPTGTPATALLAAVEQAQALGDTATADAEARQTLARLARRISSACTALSLPGMVTPQPAALRALLPPELGWVQNLLEQQRSDTAQAQSLRQTLSQHQQSLQNLTLALDQLVRHFQPVSLQQVQAARHSRNQTWQQIQTQPHELPTQAARFTEQLHEADQLADARLDRAEHEAERQAKTRQHEQQTLALQQCASELEALERRMAQRLSDWQAITQRSGLPDLPLALAPAWLQQHQQLQAALDEQAQLEQQQSLRSERVAQLQQQIWQQLQAARADSGPPAEAQPAPELAECLRRARAHISQTEQAQGQRQSLSQQAQAAQDNLHRLRLRHQAAQQEQATWLHAWQDALQAAGYPASAHPDQVEFELDSLSQLDALLGRIHSIRSERIEPMQADLDSLSAQAQRLATELASVLHTGLNPQQAPEDTALALAQALAQAEQAQRSATTLRQQLQATQAEQAANQQQQTALHARLADLFSAAGLEAPALPVGKPARSDDAQHLEALAAAVAQSDQQRLAEAALAQAERALSQAADGLSADALRQDMADTSPDDLEAELAQLTRQSGEVVEAIALHSSRHGTQKTALDAQNGSDTAAQAEARRQEALASMIDATERYLKLHTAARLLQWSMEKFRQTQQGPMLAQASALFSRLTCGSFARLLVDSEGNTPRLLGVRASGPTVDVSGMSEGSRDQLYLALRLAALSLQTDHGPRLPLIADDLFINFDDERTAAGLQVLGDLSGQMQVLFLTHHEHLVPLAQQVLGPDLNVVYL